MYDINLYMEEKFNIITGDEALAMIKSIVAKHDNGRLGLFDNKYPYVIPMNHSMVENQLYLHGAFQGKKMELMRKNPKVCYEIDAPLKQSPEGLRTCHLEYESILFFGEIKEIIDEEERYEVLKKIQQQYGMPFKHGSEKHCNAYVITLDYATARTGRFRPRGQRDLYLYNFEKK